MKPLTFLKGAVLIVLIFAATLLKSNAQSTASVVINQIYGGGGNSGAAFTHDFIELYNASSEAMDLSGWSVQYASASGISWTSILIENGKIKPGGYFLIQLSSSGENGNPIPFPDQEGSINLSSTSGKVILCSDGNERTGTDPDGEGIIDRVGYGSSATSYEATVAPSGSNSKSVQRKTDGLDTDDNSADFISDTPNPRNSSSSVLTSFINKERKTISVVHHSASPEINIHTPEKIETVSVINTEGRIESFTSARFNTNLRGILTVLIKTETDLAEEKIYKE